MKPVVMMTPGVFVPAEACAELGPALAAMLDAARRDRRITGDLTVESIERIDELGAAWRKGWRGSDVSNVSPDVSTLAEPSSEPVHWISVTTAAEILDISPQAVTGLLRRGTLAGKKVNGAWQVDAAPVSARKEPA